MSLSAGTKLGPYEIVAPLGAGGMGEVYRARDTRLGRDVAIKSLPEGFETDADRVARFEREAKLLASLHHTNIGSIFGLEVVEGRRYLVLEFIEGETLQARLSRGPLPLAETLDVCAQIATAVEAAHEAGVIHRDLKPGNVMLKADGVVKVLDFGLAKSSSGDGSPSSTDLSASPTMTYAATGVGVILGTAAYMSPEQARGKQVDRRTDIWSFGCVLFECLSGKRVIEGETVSDMVARILEREPDWSVLPAATPAHVVALLKRCLSKDARARLRDIGEARIALSGGSAAASDSFAPVAAASSAPDATRVQWRSALVLSAVALTGIALGVFLPLRRAPSTTGTATRLSVMEPALAGQFGSLGTFAISPDGRLLVFALSDSAGKERLYVRALAESEARRLDGTENAIWPFWSPDSREIAFFSDGRLRRVSASGGEARALCDATSGRGGSWGSRGQIVFAPDARGGLFVVAAGGGVPRAVTQVDSAAGETSHRFPSFLPDGKRFLFVVNKSNDADEAPVMTGSVDGGPVRLLLTATSAAVFAAPDRVVFTRDRALLAQHLDPRTLGLRGEAQQVGDQLEVVGAIQLSPPVSCSATGVMVYLPRDRRPTLLAWAEADGRLTPTRVEFPGAAGIGALSPDGRRYVITVSEPAGYANWVGDMETGAVAQIAPAGRGVHNPAWNPSGTRVIGPSMAGLRQLDPASGADSVFSFGDQLWRVVTGWSPGGGTVFLSTLVEGNRYDIQTVELSDGAKPSPWLATGAYEGLAAPSPDGRHVAYISDATGRHEVYVTDYPARTQTLRVGPSLLAANGDASIGLEWSRDGRELYFLSGDGLNLMAVELGFTPAPVVHRSRILRPMPRGMYGASVLKDGRLLALMPKGALARSLTVASGWMTELEKTK